MDSQLSKLSHEFREAESEADRREIRLEAQKRTRDYRFSPKALTEWKTEAFAIWCVTYIPHLIPEVEDWQVPSLDDVFSYGRILIMWPATLGKTTMFSIALPLFREVKNPNLEGLGVFKDDSEAKASLKTIKDEASDNELLIADYGQLRPNPSDRSKKWNEHRADFAQRTRRGKQSSLMFYAYGSQVLGQRSHWRFADDVVTRKIAMSMVLNQQQQDWFTVDFETGPYSPQDKASYAAGQDQIIVQMTAMTADDLGNYLQTRITDEVARRNPMVQPFKCRVVDLLDEAHERTITSRYTWEQAKAKELEMGVAAFSMRFRNKPISEKTTKFKRVYFEGGSFEGVTYPGCWNKDLTYDTALEPGMTVTIGYDPQSGSQTHQAAQAGIVMVGNVSNGTWKPRLLDWESGKTEVLGDKDPSSQIQKILRMAKRCNGLGIMPWVVLEDNNVQRALRVGIIEAAQRKDVMVRCTLSPTTGKSKWDDETGIETSIVDFENGWTEIPGMYPSDRERFQGFIEAMVKYGNSPFIDVPIAYWKARQWLYDHRGSHGKTQQVIAVTTKTPPRVAHRARRLGWVGGLVIRDAYAQQQEVNDGQRVG